MHDPSPTLVPDVRSSTVVTHLIVNGTAHYLVFHQIASVWDKNIEQIGDPFKAIPDNARPHTDPNTGDAVNILLLGSDSRVSAGDHAQWAVGARPSARSRARSRPGPTTWTARPRSPTCGSGTTCRVATSTG